MSGALLQLASLGPQDVYLTGSPEITLFKKAYMRYTNFSMETVQVTFDGGMINFGDTSTVTLDKVGDLISKIVLVVTLSNLTSTSNWGYVNKLGHAMIDSITIRIGQSDIDVHTYDWIDVYHNLYKNKSHEDRYNTMIGNVPVLKNIGTTHPLYNLYIPLDFWFNKASTSSFPICALQNQKFQISITLKNSIDIINYKGIDEPTDTDLPTISSGYLLVDYIYLENDERNLFIANNHEYMIEQVQEMEDTLTSNDTKISLIFDKPCKFLIWFTNLYKYFERTPYLVWSSNDDWIAARDLFAKLVWLATRIGLDASDKTNPTISFGTGFVNIGTVPATVANGNSILQKLAAKISGIILFAELDPNTDDVNTNNLVPTTYYKIKNIGTLTTLPPWTTAGWLGTSMPVVGSTFTCIAITVAGGVCVSENIIAKATPENVILTKNDITMEDMSYTIDEIKAANTNTTDVITNQYDFLDIYTVSIIDYFNTGNFIDRSDNPIVLSSFQLNGKNKFQQRDGYFFNYLQPYYYFTNTPPDGINTYSFSLEPENIQPSGTINLGYINSKDLLISLGRYNTTDNTYFSTYYKTGRIRIFTYSYTYLKIAQGQATLVY